MQSKLFKAALIMLLMGGVLSAQIATDTEIKWIRLDGVELTDNNDPVKLADTEFAGCISMNKLAAGQDGAAAMTVSEAGKTFAFGLGIINNVSSNPPLIDYSIVVSNTNFWVYVNKAVRVTNSFDLASPIDFQIEREGNAVVFYKIVDGVSTVLWEELNQRSVGLHADLVIYDEPNGALADFTVSFDDFLKIERTIEHVTADSLAAGKINLEIISQKPASDYTVEWSNGAVGQEIDGLAPGKYIAQIKDNGVLVGEKEVVVAHVVEWGTMDNIVKQEVDGEGEIIRTDANSSWEGAMATSINQFALVGNGWIELQGSYSDAKFSFGLSTSEDPSLLGMTHSFVYENGLWNIYEAGITRRLDPKTAFKLDERETLRIERKNNEIYYYRVTAEGKLIALRSKPTPCEGYDEFHIALVIASGTVKGSIISSAGAPPPEPEATVYPYMQVKRKLDGSFARTSNDHVLRIKYYEEYRDGDLQYTVYERYLGENSTTIEYPAWKFAPKKYGVNYLELDLSGMGLTSEQFYILEVINDKDESQFLRFIAD